MLISITQLVFDIENPLNVFNISQLVIWLIIIPLFQTCRNHSSFMSIQYHAHIYSDKNVNLYKFPRNFSQSNIKHNFTDHDLCMLSKTS